MYHILFIHSSVEGHLGCVLPIMNDTAMNIVEQVSFLTLNLTFCELDVPRRASIHWADMVIAFRFGNYKWGLYEHPHTFPPPLDRKQRAHSVEFDESLLSSARNCPPFPAPHCINTGNKWEFLLGVHRHQNLVSAGFWIWAIPISE